MGLGFGGGGSNPVVYTLVNPSLGLSTSARLLVNNITYYKNSIYLANLINDEILKIKAYNAAVPNNILGNLAAQANITNIENLNLGSVITQSNSYYSLGSQG